LGQVYADLACFGRSERQRDRNPPRLKLPKPNLLKLFPAQAAKLNLPTGLTTGFSLRDTTMQYSWAT
jgi:hypothetical protein